MGVRDGNAPTTGSHNDIAEFVRRSINGISQTRMRQGKRQHRTLRKRIRSTFDNRNGRAASKPAAINDPAEIGVRAMDSASPVLRETVRRGIKSMVASHPSGPCPPSTDTGHVEQPQNAGEAHTGQIRVTTMAIDHPRRLKRFRQCTSGARSAVPNAVAGMVPPTRERILIEPQNRPELTQRIPREDIRAGRTVYAPHDLARLPLEYFLRQQTCRTKLRDGGGGGSTGPPIYPPSTPIPTRYVVSAER